MRNKYKILSTVVIATVLVFSFNILAQTDVTTTTSKSTPAGKNIVQKVQSHCPVLGGTIDKQVFTDYKGKRVYFCCSSCIQEFKNDPEKFMKKIHEEGIKLEDSPSTK
ncbi:MAG: TA0938 family protein [Oligoflexia bacterium]|nr:TA0938 family protein [Oligoflexia bacterium]